MNYTTAKKEGVLIAEKNGCELLQVKDGKKYHYLMHSPKTGDHSIVTLAPMIDDNGVANRVRTHWIGFIQSQTEY